VSEKKAFCEREFPASRQFTIDVGIMSMQKHRIKALIEIDVTDSRKLLKKHRIENNADISFTAWIIKCISQAVDEHKSVHAIRKGKNQLVVFDDIDISVLVEKELDGEKVPLPVVVRKTNEKSAEAISQEIRVAKQLQVSDEKNYVLGESQNEWSIKIFLALPQFLRLLIWRMMLRNPFRLQKMMGTVVVTSLGMMGNIKGWAIPTSIHPICFALGTVIKKPGVIRSQMEIREYLPMTILFDHDVVDGAPAARFLSRLTKIIENGELIK
jgi:pyruvate/2-oxoglutarate dehydrogenase complex dihydrolipoamide acyltransferase (E2) component